MLIDYTKKFHLEGKNAVIIGGLGLIGTEVSIACAMAGAKTIVLDVKEKDGKLFENEMANEGFDLSYHFFNCSDMNNLEKTFINFIDKHGCPDVFINCSYPISKDWAIGSFEKITLKSFQKNIDIHMNSYAWLGRLAAQAMVQKETSGSIINLCSIYGIVAQDLTVYKGTNMHENMAYSAIKGGIINLCRQMASYYGQFGIRVNALCPGGLKGHVAGESKKQNPLFEKQYSLKTPLKRLGKPEEIASAALFLASDASSYITGATIMVDGGWTAV